MSSATLLQDPAGVYGQMTFDSRSCYLDTVAILARGSSLAESHIAELAVECARRNPAPPASSASSPDLPYDAVQRHVGYYLRGRGRPILEQRIGYRPSLKESIRKFVGCRAKAIYLGGIVLVAIVGLALAAAAGRWAGVFDSAWSVAHFFLFLLAAGGVTHFAVSFVDWLCTLLIVPEPVMRLDFAGGIPSDHRTLVAVPTMLTNERAVSTLLHQLELRFLANRDKNLSFALITDFADADHSMLPGDAEALNAAREGIERLNRRFGNGFYLMHRPRVWNAQEGVWMGSERKRGKLAALNRLLLNGNAPEFDVTAGDLSRLAAVRYVITLDTDTRLPRDVGRELVGCMAHPLNRPRSEATTRADRGARSSSAPSEHDIPGCPAQSLQPHTGRRSRHRPVHASKQSCLPRPFRRRELHWERNLRCSGVGCRGRRTIPRQPRLEPRSDRGLFCP